VRRADHRRERGLHHTTMLPHPREPIGPRGEPDGVLRLRRGSLDEVGRDQPMHPS
jgi:hypothetical protein